MSKYSIIIPALNEEKRIENTILSIENFFNIHKNLQEIIVVDDGSTDKTIKIIEKIQEKFENIKLIKITKNTGKGNAVKIGVMSSVGDYILFTDADGSTPIDEIIKFEKNIGNYDIIIGSRKLKESIIEEKQPFYRKIIAKIGELFISIIIKDIKDTQCGFKLIKRGAAEKIFNIQKIKRFGFDIEILAIAKLYNLKILELPIRWHNVHGTKFRPIRDSLLTIKDIFIIYNNLLRKKY